MKKIILIFAFSLVFYNCGSSRALINSDKNVMNVLIDIDNVIDDRVFVKVRPSGFITNTTTFYIPKTIPGTYSIDNYGKYIEEFKALDKRGNSLPVVHADENSWVISNAQDIESITYYVNDTYDTENTVDEAVFSPAGTNISAGDNFVLNLHGFVGYFKGLKEYAYKLSVKKPIALKSTTSLKTSLESTDAVEQFIASRYFEVVDSPILYAKPNSETFLINDIAVTLSVYSPNNVYSAKSLIDRMAKMMRAQKAFLGDIDGTKEYNILLYLSSVDKEDANGFGALEHHTSTVVVLPEAMSKEKLEQTMVDVVSHEFFHIVTPLSVHSEEVQFFDFNTPSMSKHLWMYEGTTEYFANLFQIQQGLISDVEFYKRIVGKIENAKSYDDTISFTVMSKGILEEKYKESYANVYEKGALINMALDIRLRELSNGEKGVLWLMKELSKKYGKHIPFKDDELISEIVALTYPEIHTFFSDHVVGGVPVDYFFYLNKVGLSVVKENITTGYFLNGDIPFIDVNAEDGNSIFVRKGIVLNSFLTDLGVKNGDVVKRVNGVVVSLESIRDIIGSSYSWFPSTEITMVVNREGEELKLVGSAGVSTLQVEILKNMEDISPKVLTLRNAWLKK